MDLLAAERFNGRLNRAKAWALACFVAAGALLIASLLLEPPAQPSPDRGTPPGHTASVR
jgi:hypothetical protein